MNRWISNQIWITAIVLVVQSVAGTQSLEQMLTQFRLDCGPGADTILQHRIVTDTIVPSFRGETTLYPLSQRCLRALDRLQGSVLPGSADPFYIELVYAENKDMQPDAFLPADLSHVRALRGKAALGLLPKTMPVISRRLVALGSDDPMRDAAQWNSFAKELGKLPHLRRLSLSLSADWALRLGDMGSLKPSLSGESLVTTLCQAAPLLERLTVRIVDVYEPMDVLPMLKQLLGAIQEIPRIHVQVVQHTNMAAKPMDRLQEAWMRLGLNFPAVQVGWHSAGPSLVQITMAAINPIQPRVGQKRSWKQQAMTLTPAGDDYQFTGHEQEVEGYLTAEYAEFLLRDLVDPAKDFDGNIMIKP